MGLFFLGGGCCNLGGLFDVLIETLKIILEMEKDHTFIYVLNETRMCRFKRVHLNYVNGSRVQSA